MEQKILYLTLKGKWYDMIEAGIKPEEYRDIKPFWIKRLFDFNGPEEFPNDNRWDHENAFYDLTVNKFPWDEVKESYWMELKNFTHVQFARGGHFHPSIPQMLLELKGIVVGTGNSEWGAEKEKEYFTIQLGNIISKSV
jgi:hypothetical protein